MLNEYENKNRLLMILIFPQYQIFSCNYQEFNGYGT